MEMPGEAKLPFGHLFVAGGNKSGAAKSLFQSSKKGEANGALLLWIVEFKQRLDRAVDISRQGLRLIVKFSVVDLACAISSEGERELVFIF